MISRPVWVLSRHCSCSDRSKDRRLPFERATSLLWAFQTGNDFRDPGLLLPVPPFACYTRLHPEKTDICFHLIHKCDRLPRLRMFPLYKKQQREQCPGIRKRGPSFLDTTNLEILRLQYSQWMMRRTILSLGFGS